MKYRQFGSQGWNVSALGFGTMHLPLKAGNHLDPDADESIRMIRYAVDHGVNYLDLGFHYNTGQHESTVRIIGLALQNDYEKKVKVAVTLPSFLIGSYQDFDRYLNEQLLWLNLEKIDFCLLGGLNRETWPKLESLEVLRWTEKALKDGRIDRIGFSFHDDFRFLREIVNAYERWALCQMQYSTMDVDHHPGTSGIRYAFDQGLAIVVSEPFRGGRLAKKPPGPIAEIWETSPLKRSPAEWGLRFIWDHPEVSTIVCGMSTMEQVAENITMADRAEPDALTVRELVVIGRVREAYRKRKPLRCTTCRACMPCPQRIDVPRLFEIYNDAVIYEDIKRSQCLYENEKHTIENCNECGRCAKACGRKIAIPEKLKIVHQLLDQCKLFQEKERNVYEIRY